MNFIFNFFIITAFTLFLGCSNNNNESVKSSDRASENIKTLSCDSYMFLHDLNNSSPASTKSLLKIFGKVGSVFTNINFFYSEGLQAMVYEFDVDESKSDEVKTVFDQLSEISHLSGYCNGDISVF